LQECINIKSGQIYLHRVQNITVLNFSFLVNSVYARPAHG
jgi:hypothetical protein